MDLGLRDKVALITGGSEGIGKAAALRMSEEGARVAICARRPDVLEDAATEIRAATEGEVLAVPTDVTQPEAVKALFDQVLGAYGRLDVLVNNAGGSGARSFEEVSDEEWAADLDLKLMASIRCSREAIPHMRAQGGGRIINVTAIGGKTPAARSLPSTVSRAGGIALTKALSKEYAPENILVNTVCIGLIKSGQTSRRYARMSSDNPALTLDEYWAEMGRNIPLGRIGESQEAANVILFLASNMGSYITGVSINIDGGTSTVT